MAVRDRESPLWPLRRLAAAGATMSDGELLDRFVRERDEEAFAVLVQRYGPMVLGVCRRLVPDPHDAEDAFQATFLVLARRGADLGRGGRLGPWLYGVARRVAGRARARARRYRAYVRPLGSDHPARENPAAGAAEVRAVLDAEIDRLPERYRVPFVMCCVQGLTLDRAAEALGSTRGTVASWLFRARDRLRARLADRGLWVPAGVAALAVPAAVPPRLAAAAVRTAAEALSHSGSAAPVAGLARSAARGWSRASAAALAVAAGVIGLALALRPAEPPPRTPPGAEPPAAWGERARLTGPPGGVYALAFAPGGELITSGLTDEPGAEAVHLWDPATGARRPILAGALGGAPLAVSPDGHTVAVAGRELRLEDLGPGGRTAAFADPGGAFVAFSPDGRAVACGDPRGSVRVWDRVAGRLAAGHEFAGGVGRAAAFTPDGRALALVQEERTDDTPVRLRMVRWDLDTDEVRTTGRAAVAGPVSVAMSADGRTLAVADRGDRTVGLWDVATGQRVRSLRVPGPPAAAAVTALAFSPAGRSLATGGEDGGLTVWDPDRGAMVARWDGHADRVTAVAFAADSRALGSADRHGDVRVWAADRPGPPPAARPEPGRVTLRGPPGVQALAFRPDGRAVAAAGASGRVPFGVEGRAAARAAMAVQVWDAATGRKLAALEAPARGPAANVAALAFAPDGRTLAAAGAGVVVWDLATGAERAALGGPGVAAVAFGPDGRTVALAPVGGELALWDLAGGPVAVRRPAAADAVAFAADGRTVIAGGHGTDGAAGVTVCDIRADRPRATRALGPEARAGRLVLAPTGRRAATVDHATGVVTVWDVETGRREAVLDNRAPGPGWYPMAFAADADRLAVGHPDGTVVVWDVRRTAVIDRARAHRSAVTAVAFGPAARLASADADGWIEVRDTPAAVRPEEIPGR